MVNSFRVVVSVGCFLLKVSNAWGICHFAFPAFLDFWWPLLECFWDFDVVMLHLLHTWTLDHLHFLLGDRESTIAVI